MIEIFNRVFVGSMDDLTATNDSEWAFVHATKSIFNTLSCPTNRVIHEEGNRLYLNWIDVEDYRFFDYEEAGVQNVIAALDFIDNWRRHKKVLIHCDQGVSRGPSLGMTWLFKRSGMIDNGISANRKKFLDIYPEYYPTGGIHMFLFLNWGDIK